MEPIKNPRPWKILSNWRMTYQESEGNVTSSQQSKVKQFTQHLGISQAIEYNSCSQIKKYVDQAVEIRYDKFCQCYWSN